ncbi:B12-binding domain-containing radical SAM protein [Belliella kenyensis]|uniref:B12-binding domain-containing radical SAM protein n=1 Tax=Belliella kenyensis TaxID=1472724 RepID=A0ABV8EJ20_9BACT|nr:radical SAM protein [Belliella kenyensis]MCH7400404.1 radical SAM protein [Belliella kenyensis]MDN3604578.1 radical SAM protein [Belliella kenyensis]
MNTSVLLITPPFTQLNTPYPATAYIKGFLNTLGVASFQVDLGLNVILKVFSKEHLYKIFEKAEGRRHSNTSNQSRRILKLKKEYLKTVDQVVTFLQHKNPTLAYNICDGDFLPQGERFAQIDELDWAFGSMGIQDRARHLCTLYLEDLGDMIQELVDPNFGFSRYAERLGRSAVDFDPIEKALKNSGSFIDELICQELESAIEATNPTLVCITVPFPGNLFGGLRCGQFIKSQYPNIKIVMGGGYPNTELRSLKEPRIFQYVDFISLDDGERPLELLIHHLQGEVTVENLKRTYALNNGQVYYYNASKQADIPFSKTGTPDYTDLRLRDYLSVIEVVNPMHRLWSDGRWNKLTMAHGCYWKKCTFCDISLDYIKNYEPISAKLICDRIEQIISQTGQTGFHFVDEAAPPALMRELAIELIKRELSITWWTNIRFEERFTYDLCRLLKSSGCIAVSGGLEVASDRLLKLMQKGVDVAQVARVARNFTETGIMVHAYLMYGFPTQTDQETIDSLEMVRQLFENQVIQSGFWHQFAMTSHAPIGMNPEKFGVMKIGPKEGLFADNDLEHVDPTGADHDMYGKGLKKALFNYMHGICFDFPLQEWFDFKIPKTTIAKNYIYSAISSPELASPKLNSKIIWLGSSPELAKLVLKSKSKKSNTQILEVENLNGKIEITLPSQIAEWMVNSIGQMILKPDQDCLTFGNFKQSYEECGFGDVEKLIHSELWIDLMDGGLVVV